MLNRPVYIDLEGADLTGKSTLLKDTFRKGDYSKIMCFHDRGILTHYIYNQTFERYGEDLSLWWNELTGFIKHNGIIVLVGSEAELVNRYQKRSDDLFKLSNIVKMNEAYKKLCRDFLSSFFTVKVIEIDGKTPDQIYREAEKLYIYMMGRGVA